MMPIVGMKSERSHDTFVPFSVLPELQMAAEEDHRAPSERVGEAVARYLAQRRWFRKGNIHAKIAQGLESLHQGKGRDGEAVMAKLIAELDEAERAG